MKPALILFAHGARDPEWAAPMRRVQDAVRALQPDVRVELAFLEFMTPTLAECAETLLAEGYDKLTVVPMFIAQGGHLKRDVPALIEQLRSTRKSVEISLLPAIGEQESVVQAMAAAALREAGL